jgi:hypothetical protein
METLTSKLQEKIDNAVIRNEENVKNNYALFSSTTGSMNDAIISINGVRPAILSEEQKLIFQYPVTDVIEVPERKIIHVNALDQMSEKMKIPTRYMRLLAEGQDWQKDLAAQTLNEHMKYTTRTKVLVRNVGNEMRAFLSDSYKRINSTEVIKNYMNAVKANNMLVYDFHYGDTKFYLETIDRNVVMIDTPNNGSVGMVFGMRLKNSDFGDGALELSSYLLQVICMNGMVRRNALREIHLGAKLQDNIVYSQKTYELNTAASVSALNDTVQTLVGPDYREIMIQSIKRTSEVIVEPEKELKKLQPMGVLKEEIEEVGNLLMANRPEDGLEGASTAFKFAQAVSAIGRNKSPQRNREIQEISAKLLDQYFIN